MFLYLLSGNRRKCLTEHCWDRTNSARKAIVLRYKNFTVIMLRKCQNFMLVPQMMNYNKPQRTWQVIDLSATAPGNGRICKAKQAAILFIVTITHVPDPKC